MKILIFIMCLLSFNAWSYDYTNIRKEIRNIDNFKHKFKCHDDYITYRKFFSSLDYKMFYGNPRLTIYKFPSRDFREITLNQDEKEYLKKILNPILDNCEKETMDILDKF